MQWIIAFIEQMLYLVMLVIVLKPWFALRKPKAFLGGSLLGFSLALCMVWICFGLLIRLLLVWLLSLLYLRMLFKGTWWKLAAACTLLSILSTLLRFAFLAFFQSEGIDMETGNPVEFFLADLFMQLSIYGLSMLAAFLLKDRSYPFTYYFPLLPLLLTVAFLILWKSMDTSEVSMQVLYLVLFAIAGFDFLCLVLQSWMIASMHTRRRVRAEQARREQLLARYRTLQAEYAISFGFLHSLLRQCADAAALPEEEASKSIAAIAKDAFKQFNALCIITPALSELLEKRKERYRSENIYVSTLLQSDHFGLMTHREQTRLFSDLLDFMENQALRLPAQVRTFAFRSKGGSREIFLIALFPCQDQEACRHAFTELQETFSRLFHAGCTLQFPSENQAEIDLMIPIESCDLEGSLSL